jgi:zinc transporter
VVVANDLTYEETADPAEVATLWSYATPRMLVTARTHALHSLDRLRSAVRDGLQVESGFELLRKLFEYQIETLEDLLARTSRTVDRIEDQILGGEISEQREHLGQVRRLCAHLRRHFSPQRAAMRKLLAHPPASLDQPDLIRLQGAEEDLGSIIADTTELHERASLLQEELASRLAEQTNRNLYVLTIITAVFLPMNLITGIFGMNVAGLPGTGDAGASSFWWVMLLIGVAAVTTVLALRLRKLL